MTDMFKGTAIQMRTLDLIATTYGTGDPDPREPGKLYSLWLHLLWLYLLSPRLLSLRLLSLRLLWLRLLSLRLLSLRLLWPDLV